MPEFLPAQKLVIQSNLENVRKVEPFLREYCNNMRLDDATYHDMLLALTEAVTNSIRHGNGCNPNKTVEISMEENNGQLHVKVHDEGCGFDHQQVPDPTAPHLKYQPNGRGLYLMRELSQNMRYADNGRCVEMSFRLKP